MGEEDGGNRRGGRKRTLYPPSPPLTRWDKARVKAKRGERRKVTPELKRDEGEGGGRRNINWRERRWLGRVAEK